MNKTIIIKTVSIVLIISLIFSGIVYADFDLFNLETEGTYTVGGSFGAGFFIHPNGEMVWTSDQTNLREHTLTEPYNISTASQTDSINLEALVQSGGGSTDIPYGIFWSNNGSLLFVEVFQNDDNRFELWVFEATTPYDINTLVEQERTIDNALYGSNGDVSIYFTNDGLRGYTTVEGGQIRQFNFNSPYNVTNATSLDETFSPTAISEPYGMWLSNDGSKMYVSDRGIGSDDIHQYTLTEEFNISTAIHNGSINSGLDRPAEMSWVDNGNYFYTISWSNPTIQQWQSPFTALIRGTVTDENNNELNNVEIYVNNTLTTTTNDKGLYQLELQNGNYSIKAEKSGYSSQTKNITIEDSNRILNFKLHSEFLTLKVNKYMDHGTEQTYNVLWTDINGTIDVTNNAIVTSSNSSVVLVVSSENKLIAISNSNINKRVQINASWTQPSTGELKETSENITVANLRLEHIDILPPSHWLPGFLDLEDGLGTSVQWLLFIILIGATLGNVSQNEWLGIGSIMGLCILFWRLGHLDLGITMVAVIYGLFIALRIQGVPSRTVIRQQVQKRQESIQDRFNQ